MPRKVGETHLLEASTSQPPSSEQPPPAKKNWWQAVLTTTPVVLTVVATLLAGLSTSEMTLAQYHRSLADQNQSKASDQWGFFQAKRIRESGMEEAFDKLPPRFKTSKGLQPSRLEAASRQLTRVLQEAEKQTAELGGMVSRPPNDTNQEQGANQGPRKNGTQKGSAGEPLRGAAARLHQATQEIVREAQGADKLLHDKLAKKQVEGAFVFLSDKLPEVDDIKFQQEDINQAVQAISDRVEENELEPTLRRIKEEDLRRALDTAEGNARRLGRCGKSVGKMLDEIDKLVRDQTSRAGDFHQAVGDYRNTLTEVLLLD